MDARETFVLRAAVNLHKLTLSKEVNLFIDTCFYKIYAECLTASVHSYADIY